MMIIIIMMINVYVQHLPSAFFAYLERRRNCCKLFLNFKNVFSPANLARSPLKVKEISTLVHGQSFPWGMNMNLWIFNLVYSAVYGINRISEPDLKAVSFAEKIAGQKLNGSLIREIDVDSESSCQLECVNEERCQSYNFGTQKGDSGKFKCQLSDSDRFVGFANFTEVENFIYRGIKVC